MFVETTNNEIGAMECLAWVLIGPDGTRLHEEQLYAARFRVGPTTI